MRIPDQRVKAAVIGAGRMGQVHIQAIQNLGWSLVGLTDTYESVSLHTLESLGLDASLAYADAQSLLHDAKPDVVSVATTAPGHCGLTCEAARAGARFILCEKPMAVSLNECDEMMSVCADNNVQLAINHSHAYRSSFKLYQKAVRDERFGGLCSMNVSAGNFGVAMNGSHMLNVFLSLTETRPLKVCAGFDQDDVPNPRGEQFEDAAGWLRVENEHGQRFLLECGGSQGHGVLLTFMGRSGWVLVDELGGWMRTSMREDTSRDLPSTRYACPADEHQTTFASAGILEPTEAMLQGLVTGTLKMDLHKIRQTIEILVAAYVSNEAGQVVIELGPGLPQDRRFKWA